MKNRFLYILLLAVLFATSCSDNDIADNVASLDNKAIIDAYDDYVEGELLVKFRPEMTECLDEIAVTRAGVATRSGIPSTDEVLDILKAYKFERIFPVDKRNEERTRKAGMHLWYRVGT